MFLIQADKANLVNMFDRETRREKVLENLAKEARIKAAAAEAKTEAGMMRSAVIAVKMKSKFAKHGYDTLRQRAHGKTVEEELRDARLKEAEEKFFKSIQTMKDDRIASGKPLFYSA